MRETIIFEVEGENGPLVCFFYCSQEKLAICWKVILCFDLSNSFQSAFMCYKNWAVTPIPITWIL